MHNFSSVPNADKELFSQDKPIVVDSKVLMLDVYDEMEAYLLLPTPPMGESYTLTEIKETIEGAGVKIGIDEAKISAMLENYFYDREMLIAQGIPAVHGVDAFFEYHFDNEESEDLDDDEN